MSEERLIDQDQRDRAIYDIHESYLVEASAGTGKTTLLVKRIIEILRAGAARLDEIVAITFTEKAASELKVKLREELEQILLGPLDSEVGSRISKAISDLERMEVTTIHSFCASLLRERPVEAGIDPNFEVADELTASLIQNEVWERWIGRKMESEDPVLTRAVGLGITLKQIHKIGQSLLGNLDLLESLPTPLLLQEVDEAVKDFVNSFHKRILSLEDLKSHYCKNPVEDKASKKIEELHEKFFELQSLPEEEREGFIFKEIKIGASSRLGAQKNWLDPTSLEKVRKEIETLSALHEKVRALIAHTVLSSLGECLSDYVQAYRKAKQERNLLDFNDLLLMARNMLRDHPQVRKYFQSRYPYLLVDEFQDTDPLQVEIIFFLSPKNLFLVGDPKQSIYRFRRADIEIYEEAKKRMGESRLLNISQNFRCAPSIVRVVNRIFQDLIRLPEEGKYQPEYVPLHFGRKKATVPPRHGILLLSPPKDQGILLRTAADCRLWESRCIAAFIQKMVEETWPIWDGSQESFRPIQFKDIAILMRSYNCLDFLEEALRSYGVDYRVIGGKSFYFRQEVEQLLTLLQTIENPYDQVSLIACLRSPFFGISDEELFMFHARGGELNYLKGARGTSLERPFQFLRELHEIRNQGSVSALLKRLYEETAGLILYLLKPQGEQRVANLLKIGEIARALEQRGMLSFRGFVRWLSERKGEGAEEEEPPTLERGENFVRLLTIHRAKGLEFPMVILTDLAHSGGVESQDFIIDRSGGKIAFKIGNKENRFWTRNYEEMREWEEKRGKAEEHRLLYVGMTRARDFLVLPVYWEEERKSREGRSYLASIQPYLPNPDQGGFEEWMDEMTLYDTDSLNLTPETAPPFRFPLGIEMKEGKASSEVLSQRKQWKESQEDLRRHFGGGRLLLSPSEKVLEFERDEEWIISKEGLTEGALFGKLVHRLFEKMDWKRPEMIDPLTEKEGKGLGATQSMIERAGKLVKEAISSPLFQRVIRSENYQKEVPFTYFEEGMMIEGVMDLVFREGEDWVVLDFKTDRIDPKQLEARVNHYRPQVRIYSEAIQKIFGKPPKEVILFFLHQMEPVSIPFPCTS